MADANKHVYHFGEKRTDGAATQEMRELLGGKGANLAEMCRIGLPVPPGFTITTAVCTYFVDHKGAYPNGVEEQVKESLDLMEQESGKTFGDPNNPMLVSVRSGARDSMPGMMDTILNLGLNDTTVEGLAKLTGNDRFAWDSYRRFFQMYGDVVLGVQPESEDDHEPFEVVLSGLKKEVGVTLDTDLTTANLKELVKRYKSLVKEKTGRDFPVDPMEQLWGAVAAVFGSWNNERAFIYRRKYNIPHSWGTAVNVQSMVFGNMGNDSGTGVAFTRDPASGEKVFYGEYLINAQGEDVVAGVRTPKPIAELEKDMPVAFKELMDVRETLEQRFRDMQDFEFTIERNKLYMLQTRNGKRTGLAAVRIAVELVEEGLLDWKQAVAKVPPDSLEHVLAPIFNFNALAQAETDKRLIAKGLPAGPGAATGKVVFNAARAEELSRKGERVLLVRIETSPEDLRGMLAADGILTARGGVSSHAALVARQMGKVCVCGCQELVIDYEKRTISVGDTVIKDGEYLSIEGTTGRVFAGQIETAPSEVIQVLVDKSLKAEDSAIYRQFATVMEWADKARTMNVRTNADQPDQVANAMAFGAEGIGLCRTEHMFFGGDRIVAVREMILADDLTGREKALEKLLPYQREDFTAIFETLNGLPATIRALDPPLHEFLPHQAHEIKEVADQLGISVEEIEEKVESLHEANPMLGHRGCRLGIAYPEVTAMQARAIFEAACDVAAKGIPVHPEIMIPLVGTRKELSLQKDIVDSTAKQVFAEKGRTVEYQVGTMIEIPRAALTADEIAEDAEFFSFGTNDLTQTTLGISRDDAGKFLTLYQELDIYGQDPFASIDQTGVGQLMEIGVTKGRTTRPDLKIGICGEHGGEPKSVEFCHRLGLNYVSCSPFRVPVARLAAAQAALKG
ncbi:MAG: pyruvate, phosphate dikinase [Candidatus Poribacteria bacterium]|nr:pyruvate, phosphate dikinase [Candidatus Poribacteria bacterium]